MAAMLVFFAVGLAEFAVVTMLQDRPAGLRFWILAATGLAAGAAIAALPVRFPFFGFRMPRVLPVWIGGVSGLLVALAEAKRAFRGQWLPFFITPLLGLVLAVAAAAVIVTASLLRHSPLPVRDFWGPVSLVSVLIGLMTAFGYTLPRRWFQRFMD
jgi:hypothetical protein